jgi:hypothetical protein
MPETIDETVQQPGKIEATLDRLEGLMKGFLLSVATKQGTQQSEIPYYGPDRTLYALDGEAGYLIPIANYQGEITLPSLKRAYAELSGDDAFVTDMLTPQQQIQAMRKILSSYHALMFDDTDFETQIQSSLDAAREPEQVLQEAGESLGENATIYEFAYTATEKVDFEVDQLTETGQVVYRNVLRTGTWQVAPNNSKEPLVITKQMLDNLVTGFNDGAFEYVTVPETHEDLPSQNRGFIRKLEVLSDPAREGEYILRGGFEFTNEDARKAALEGSIAGVSCGIVFNHKRKSDGQLFESALHHVALTNKPWIDGLGNWEKIAASEFNAEVVVGLEQEDNNVVSQENMTMTEGTTETTQLSQADFDALVAENTRLKLAQTRNDVKETLRPYQTEKNLTPAVLALAEKLMLAAAVTPKMMTLSESNVQEELDLHATVKAMLDAMPEGVSLSENVAPADQTAPPLEAAQPTPEEKAAKFREEIGLKPVE